MNYDGISGRDLEDRFDDLYRQINAALDSLPAATWTAPYKAARRDIMTMETEFHAIGAELHRRAAVRIAAWDMMIDAEIRALTDGLPGE